MRTASIEEYMADEALNLTRDDVVRNLRNIADRLESGQYDGEDHALLQHVAARANYYQMARGGGMSADEVARTMSAGAFADLSPENKSRWLASGGKVTGNY